MTRDVHIDLVLTDIVLPGGGPDLAHEVRQHLPEAKVLFMSGYAENYVNRHDRANLGGELLQRPFRRRDLARKVRAALDARMV